MNQGTCPFVGSHPFPGMVVPSRLLAEAAAYVMCYLLIEAGYFIGIGKSQV